MIERSLLATVLVLGLAPLAQAHGPTRQKVTVEREIAAPVADCWAMVGNFAALHEWLPPVERTEMLSGAPDEAGAVRALTVGDAVIEETLKSVKPDRMQLKYKITKGDLDVLPVTNYSSTLSVKAAGEGCAVKWLGAFYRGFPNNDPPEHLNDEAAINAVTGLYNLGLDNLKQVLESAQ